MLASAKAGLLATLINAVLFYLFKATSVIADTIIIPQSGEPLSIVPVVFSSLVPSFLAGIAFYLFSRYTKSGYRYFFICTVVLLILSFINPFIGIPGITLAMGLALNLMHIVVAGCLLYMFKKITVAAALHRS